MSFKSIVGALREMKERRKHWSNRTRSDIVPIEQGKWANLPPKLLSDIFRRVDESSAEIVFCSSVCKSWREIIINSIDKTALKECGRLTFPISLKQPGPSESLIRCYVKRDKANSVYRLYSAMSAPEEKRDELLLAAKRIIRVTSIDYVISLVAHDFSQASNTYAGKLRSNLFGSKFTIYDSQPPSSAAAIQQQYGQLSRKRVPAHDNVVATGSNELKNGRCNMHWALQDSVNPAGPLVLKNQAPWWNEKLQSWCLSYGDRVGITSIKNFQLLVADDEQQKIVLHFGKIGEDIFTMEYRCPLSAFQAFAICLSIFYPNLRYE